MSRFILHSFLVLALLSVGAASLQAESSLVHSPFQAKIRGLANIDQLLPESGQFNTQALTKQPNLHLSASIAGLGRVRMHFYQQRVREVVPTFTDQNGNVVADPAGVTLLRGRVKLKTSDEPVAGSIYYVADQPFFFVGFLARHFRSGHPKYYRLKIPLQTGGAKLVADVSRVSRFAKPGTCANGSLLGHLKDSSIEISPALMHQEEPILSAATYKVIQLNIDGDKEFYQIFGSNSNATISGYLNEAEVFYERDLQLTHSIVRQNVFTTRSFGTTAADNKLEAYATYSVTQSYYDDVDANHLFTGADLDGNTLGIAYSGIIGDAPGVVCRYPMFAFGLSSYSSPAYMPLTFAHELGHNLSASHDDYTSPKTIMAASLGYPLPTEFSDFSANEITGYVASYGYCLSSQSSSPTPTPTNTATPTPTSTATPTPTPTPTPAPNIPINLNVSLTRQGIFEGDISLSYSQSICTVALLGSTSKTRIFEKGKELLAYSGSETAKNFYATVNKKASSVNKKGNTVREYVAAKISCPNGDYGISSVKKIKAHRIRKRGSVSALKWFKLLGKGLTSTP